tara:strand:+ start:758 stop:1387 length:630 start_codon:yes stop_codon:yes gene_type:complete
MIIEQITFYIFAVITVISGVLVIGSRNPVHSVLFLILAFFNSAGLFVLMGAEFIAMILIIVYVGAVAVLFLFVVMMLHIDFSKLRAGFTRYLPIGCVVGIILLVELILVLTTGTVDFNIPKNVISQIPNPQAISNTEALGNLLYTQYAYLFQIAGFILLIAMVGAIVLTHKKRNEVKKQKISDQVNRDPNTAITLHKIETKEGGTWKSD